MHKREWLPEDFGTKSRFLQFGAEILSNDSGTKRRTRHFVPILSLRSAVQERVRIVKPVGRMTRGRNRPVTVPIAPNFNPEHRKVPFRAFPAAGRRDCYTIKGAMINEIAMWLGGKDAGLYIGYSRDWVECRALEWPLDDKPVPGRIRYQYNPENGDRRYYRPDLDAFLVKRFKRAA